MPREKHPARFKMSFHTILVTLICKCFLEVLSAASVNEIVVKMKNLDFATKIFEYFILPFDKNTVNQRLFIVNLLKKAYEKYLKNVIIYKNAAYLYGNMHYLVDNILNLCYPFIGNANI